MVGQVEHHAHVVLDHDQRAAFGHFPDQFNGLVGFAAAHACGRLIEEDNVRTARNGHADFEGALLGIGEHARDTVASRRHADAFHDFAGPLAHIRQRVDPMPEGILVSERPHYGAADVLVNRQFRKNVGDLEAAGQSFAIDGLRLESRDLFAVQFDATGTDRKAAADQVEQRGLPGAVWSDDRMAFARADGEIDAVDDRGAPEALAHVMELQGRRAHRAPAFCNSGVRFSQARRTTFLAP